MLRGVKSFTRTRYPNFLAARPSQLLTWCLTGGCRFYGAKFCLSALERIVNANRYIRLKKTHTGINIKEMQVLFPSPALQQNPSSNRGHRTDKNHVALQTGIFHLFSIARLFMSLPRMTLQCVCACWPKPQTPTFT